MSEVSEGREGRVMKEYKYWEWCKSCAHRESCDGCEGCARPETGTDEPSNWSWIMTDVLLPGVFSAMAKDIFGE